MIVTILHTSKFKASHPMFDDLNKVIEFDINHPYVRRGRVVGYFVKDDKVFAFALGMICEALEVGFSTSGNITLELIN